MHQRIHPKPILNVFYKNSQCSQQKNQLSRDHVDQKLHLSSSWTSVSYVETNVWQRQIPRTENAGVVWFNVQLIEDQTRTHSRKSCWIHVMYMMMNGDMKCLSGWKVQSVTCTQPTGNITEIVCHYSAAPEISNILVRFSEGWTSWRWSFYPCCELSTQRSLTHLELCGTARAVYSIPRRVFDTPHSAE